MTRGALGYVLDDVFLEHRAPAGHPERPARAEAVRDALVAARIAERGSHVITRAATDEELARVHGAAYLDHLVRVVPGNTGWLDPDTYYSPGTWDAVRTAAGSVSQLALDVMSGQFARGLAVVRPPGHHATRDQAMGFCLINNVAAAAAAARAPSTRATVTYARGSSTASRLPCGGRSPSHGAAAPAVRARASSIARGRRRRQAGFGPGATEAPRSTSPPTAS